MKKTSHNRFIAPFLIFSLSAICPVNPAQSYAALAAPVTASSYVLLDQNSGRIIHSQTPNLRRAPASTTKLLTAIVVVKNIDLNRVVTIPRYIEKIEPSKIHLRRGERYRVRELLAAVLISSANDAAETLAYAVSGSRANFARLMNRQAASIGCKSSKFVNPSGLPASGQYSTAYDMALIMREFQKYPFLVQTLAAPTLTIKSARGRKIYLKNHNKMLFRGHREVVGKTGWTRAARHCFVGHINGSRKAVISMLGSRRLWKDVLALVKYQYASSISSKAVNRKITGRKEKKRAR